MNNHYFKLFLCGIIAFVSTTTIVAQVRTQQPPGNETRQKDRPLANETIIDSINITTYNLDNIYNQDSFKTKGLDKYFQQYDPARNRNFDYGHLGNLGSAAYSLILEDNRSLNYKLGFNQYKLYQKERDDIIFFKQNTPFSELYFSGGETQSDLRVKTLFSRTFANNVNWVISYDRISQQGIYTNQAVKQTSFLTSVGFKPKNSKLSLFLSYFINASSEEINGGVSTLELFNDDGYGLRTNIPVNLSDAETRLQNQNINLTLQYSLNMDSTEYNVKTHIQYEFNYLNEFFRYSDSGISSDSSFYGRYWEDTRGIRNFAQQRQFENGFYLNNSKKDWYHFKVGLNHQYNNINLSASTDRINDIFLRFSGSLNIKKRLKIKADFHYGLLNAANLFSLNSTANLALSKTQGFDFLFRTGRFRSDQIESNFYINEQLFINNDFKKIFNQVLGGEYYNNNLHIKAGAKLSNNVNYIYFDKEGLPVQKEGLYTVSLLYLSGDFKFKSIVIENFLFLQNQSEEVVNLPEFFTKNSLSYYGKIFNKKMLLKAGLDFRYIISQKLPSYNPVIGKFTLNQDITQVPYPLVDARISFKVASFTTFAKYENLTSFISDDLDFMVLNYPQFDARFRFGILWNLWN